MFHNITVFACFDQLNAALVSIRDFIQKHFKKSYQAYTFEWNCMEITLSVKHPLSVTVTVQRVTF